MNKFSIKKRLILSIILAIIFLGILSMIFVLSYSNIIFPENRIITLILFVLGQTLITAIFIYLLLNRFIKLLNSEEKDNDLKKFQLAIENIPLSVVITNNEGIIIYSNKAIEKTTGFSQKEILGKKAGTKELWGGLMPNDFYNKMWETIKKEKDIFSGEIKNRKKNGEEYISMINIIPIKNKKEDIILFLSIERDITKEKSINQTHSEFISLACHRLRAPLSAIRWYSEMLLNEDVGKLNKEQTNFLREIYEGNKKMVELMSALQNVSRIELGTFKIEPETTDISEIADNVIKELKPKIESKKINFTKEYDKKLPKIKLDIKLAKLILKHLIDNALSYNKKEGNVFLKISKKEKDIEIIVKDNGIGIPLHQQKQIFTKLFRADNVKKNIIEGKGLGLYIVKSILEYSGGKIWFESEEKKGTTFFVSIPLSGMKYKEGSKCLG
jgi:PAS domain S-box-containing protein